MTTVDRLNFSKRRIKDIENGCVLFLRTEKGIPLEVRLPESDYALENKSSPNLNNTKGDS